MLNPVLLHFYKTEKDEEDIHGKYSSFILHFYVNLFNTLYVLII